MSRLSLALGAVLALAVSAGVAEQRTSTRAPLGSLSFPNSGAPAAQADFLRGVAWLHSFGYEEARRAFEAVLAKDPACAMAYWGIAMTWYHPIWAPPSPDDTAMSSRLR